MKTRSKKGFTIVELVIVIAVIAILTAVMIPTFSSVTKKAKVASDNVLVTNLNKALDAEEQTANGKPATMYEALQIVSDWGYDVAKINAKETSNEIVWNSVKNEFVYAKKGTYTGVNYWVISNTVSTKCSTYYTGNAANVTTALGFDAGDTNVNVKYQTTATQDVVIRTNGGNLTVDAVNSNVTHYGVSGKAYIEAVKASSYHEFGEVANIEIKKGRVEINQDAKVDTVVVTGEEVKVDTAVATVEVKIAATVTAANVQITGTTNKVENVKMVESFTEVLDGDNVLLSKDLTATQVITAKNATIDLNGHSIITNGTSVYVNNYKEGSADFVNIIGEGLIKSRTNIAIIVSENGKLRVSDITAEGQEGAILPCGYAELVVNSGVFTAFDNAVIGTNGSYPTHPSGAIYRNYSITINGGTFNGYIQTSGYIACGIYAANAGTVTVNGGTFNITNGCGILCRSGVSTIGEGVVFNLNNSADGPVQGKVGDSKVMVLSGAYIVEDKAAHYPGSVENDNGKNPIVNNNSSYGITVIEAYA